MKFSKTRLAIFTSIVLIAALVQILYNPIASIQHVVKVISVRTELPRARAQWDAWNITDYAFQIRGDGRSICKPYAEIEVRNGVVVKVETKDPVGILAPEYWADPAWGEEVFLCSYSHYTMPQIFDLVAITLRNFPASITRAEFDPQYGFVSKFRFGIYIGYGLLRPEMDDCCNEFEITDFRPLSTQ